MNRVIPLNARRVASTMSVRPTWPGTAPDGNLTPGRSTGPASGSPAIDVFDPLDERRDHLNGRRLDGLGERDTFGSSAVKPHPPEFRPGGVGRIRTCPG